MCRNEQCVFQQQFRLVDIYHAAMVYKVTRQCVYTREHVEQTYAKPETAESLNPAFNLINFYPFHLKE